jgi:hypothetical protein
MKTAITIKHGNERFHVYVQDHKQRIAAMHALARLGITAGYLTVDGFQANTNRNNNFWGSIK